jgi:alpha-galactosidase
LGFGFWVEPERFGFLTPVRQAHPGWFTTGCTLDLNLPDAYAWQADALATLITRYEPAFVKFDMNGPILGGAAANEAWPYHQNWKRLMTELREKFPRVVFENCASGGMCNDLGRLKFFDAFFPSDQVDPMAVEMMLPALARRLPLARMSRWAVVCNADTIPADARDEGLNVLVSNLAGWNQVTRMNILSVLASLAGHCPGYSGDLAGLNQEQLRRVAEFNALHKANRDWLGRSIHYPLLHDAQSRVTLVMNTEHTKGWLKYHRANHLPEKSFDIALPFRGPWQTRRIFPETTAPMLARNTFTIPRAGTFGGEWKSGIFELNKKIL